MLEEMLASVRGQGFAEWELCLCVDDRSGPRVREGLDRAAGEDSRIRVSQCDEGGAAAVAEGLRMASGDFVGLLGDADRLDREALATVDGGTERRSNIEWLSSCTPLVSGGCPRPSLR